MRLFRKKDTAEATDIVYEKWHTSFSRFQDHRFTGETGEDYSSSAGRGNLSLELKRKNLFAWTDDRLYRYENFLLKADLSIDPANGYCSTGFLFRRTDDISYYYFLVSSRGYFRLDSVLNGTPRVIIDWTECSDFNREKFSVAVLAEGSSISLFLDGQWIGSASDEGLTAGGISFAGQNYDEKDRALFRLERIEVESRPAIIEKAAAKLNPEGVPADARMRFAESRMRSGHHAAALIELKRVIGGGEGGTKALLMAADCAASLEMYDEALGFLDRIPPEDRDGTCIMQRAAILYMTNNFLASRNLLAEHPQLPAGSQAASNLLGNAEFAVGNWGAAADAYMKACELDPEQAIYALNAARALEKSGKTDEAASMYGRAAAKYFRDEEYDELAGILPFLERLDANKAETQILRAKLLFHDGEFDKADRIFSSLIQENLADSTVYYLNALIEARKGKKRKAISSFRKALELEPDYYLYHFKMAEYQFLTGGKYREGLEKSLELAPEDPWVQNLAGLAALEENNPAAAISFFSAAAEAKPEADEITVNLSEAFFLDGRPDEALNLLAGETSALHNQRGNIHSRRNDFAAAVREYEAAFELDRRSPDIMLNLAAACIESDTFSRAEELLIRVLEGGENAQAYNLMGNLALLKGEYSRAEAAYSRAVELDPEFSEAVCNLADFYVSRERLNDADLLLEAFRGENPGERFEALKETVFRKRMSVYSCSSCDREWIVPRKMAQQPPLKLVGEPDDGMPAGKCSNCGKVYCIGCAKENLSGGRMICSECGTPLKLSEDWMRWLYHGQL